MNEQMDRKVAIPASHFTDSVKRNYSEHETALIREFLQNAVDAGASEIKFVLDDHSLSITDNGCGMDEDILVRALLTMSGTHKRAGAIGGFGAAKEILLFQHDHYTVRTQDNFVQGKVLDYSLTKIDRVDGTTIQIWFHENYEFNYAYFEDLALRFLRGCQTEAKIFWNDERVTTMIKTGEMVREMEWAKVHLLEDVGHEYVYVRINGVTMFKVYAPQCPHLVVVEITKPSLQILTVNRDGFTWDYSQKLNSLISEIVIEKAAFGRLFNTQTTFRGKQRAYTDFEFYRRVERVLFEAKVITEAVSVEEVQGLVEAKAKEMGVDLANADRHQAAQVVGNLARYMAESAQIKEEIINDMIEDLEMVCDHEADFVVLVQSKSMNVLPDYLKPGQMSPRFAMYAKLWKRCIRLVLSANGVNRPYTIGWVIADNAAKRPVLATHEVINGVQTILLNPQAGWLRSSIHRETFHQMLILAVHEVTHLFCKFHDESFVDMHEKLMYKTLMSLDSWWKEYLAAKEEVL